MMKKPMEDDIENVGIMQGFMDSASEDGESESEDDDEGESMPEMERSPKSPEILMNNLRGDMRSVDARRDELADLVGYQAATETPEPVLAMLQPILAQQGGGGIGALPQSGPMAQGPQAPMMPPPGVGEPMGGPLPPGGIAGAPMGAPPGAPPAQPPAAPMGMARGGYVQHFQAGSNESGVTPADDEAASDNPMLAYSPALVRAAQTETANLINRKAAAIPTLEAATAARLPQYQKMLGADKEMSQAQMLLELGQRAFGFASNVDEAGRPLRGGFGARLAGAVKTLPTAIGRHVEAMDKIDRQINMLALQQGEKDIDQVVTQNTDLLKRKSELFREVLKADARLQAERMKGVGSSIFGKGDWEWNVVNMPGLLEKYGAGQTDDKETRLVQSAITKFNTPRYETHFDPVTKMPFTKIMPVTLPGFVKEAEAARVKLNLSPAPTPQLAPRGASGPTTVTTPGGVRADAIPGSAPPAAAGAQPTAAAPAEGAPPTISLWNDRFKVSGPISAAINFISGIPGLGDPAANITLARQQATQQAERVIDSLMKSTAGSVREQERLRPVIGILPNATLDPDAYGTKLIALGSTLQDMIREYDSQGLDNSGLKPEDKGKARQRAMDLRRQYNMLGLPPAVYSEAEFKRLPPGTEVLWMGRTPAKVQ
jgi:hypothetical protein